MKDKAEIKRYVLDLKVFSMDRVSAGNVLIKLTDEEPLSGMLPGQFVEVRVDGPPSTFLHRPISVNPVDRERDELWLLVAIVGEGTRTLARLREGDRLDCVLPLGDTFAPLARSSERVSLVGDGVGVAPLLCFGKRIKNAGGLPVFLLGARTAADLAKISLFEKCGKVCITIEDGSTGEEGFVTNRSILFTERFDRISTCGFEPMMMTVARYAHKTSVPCGVSLESMMAYGVGACLCCIEKAAGEDLCVCTEDPVFDTRRLMWGE